MMQTMRSTQRSKTLGEVIGLIALMGLLCSIWFPNFASAPDLRPTRGMDEATMGHNHGRVVFLAPYEYLNYLERQTARARE
jgi:hypothetical protein